MTMVNFDSYLKNVLGTLNVCGVPTMAMKGLCDDDGLFVGTDLDSSVGVNIADSYVNSLGHGDMYIYKGRNGEVKGVELTNVSSNFLSIIRGNQMLYGVRYQTIRQNYSNNYVIYF